jgi:hypothetical protein
MGKRILKEKIETIRTVKCYLTDTGGVEHRIARMNTGRIVMLDHQWEDIKLLRAMAKPSLCCYDFIVGKSVYGHKVPQLFPISGRHDKSDVTLRPALVHTPPNYLRTLRAKMDSATAQLGNLLNGGPYNKYSTSFIWSYISKCHTDSTHLKDRMPQWRDAPKGRADAGIISIAYNVEMYMDSTKHTDTLGKHFRVEKVPRKDAYTYVPGLVPRYSSPYFLPYILDHRVGDVRMVKGFLVDPDVTKLSERIRFARACITADNVLILSIQNLEVKPRY